MSENIFSPLRAGLNNMLFLVTPLYYDQPEYDIFWQTLSDLDVPLYLHPRTDVAPILNFQYSHSPFLIGPAQQYTATLSGHILGYAFKSQYIPIF